MGIPLQLPQKLGQTTHKYKTNGLSGCFFMYLGKLL